LGILAVGALLYATYQWSVSWLQGARESSNSVGEQSLNPENAVAEIQANTSLTVPVKQTVGNVATEQSTELASETVSIDESVLTAEPAASELEGDITLDKPVPDSGLNNQSSIPAPARTTQTDVPLPSVEILRFNFVESSWVEVFGVNGKRLIYGMANQGTVREIALSGPTEIFLGNAQGTLITLNGSTYNIPANARAGRTARFVLEPDR
jgi:cytoskeletal protein RodZ